MEVPVQYFQSVIPIKLAVAGQMRFFESSTARGDGARFRTRGSGLPSLLSSGRQCSHRCGRWPTRDQSGPRYSSRSDSRCRSFRYCCGCYRPLAKDATTSERDPQYGVTVVGLFFYVVVVGGVLLLLGTE